MNEKAAAIKKKFLQGVEKRCGMLAFDGTAIDPAEHFLGEVHVGGEEKNLDAGIEVLEGDGDLIAIHLRHGVVEDDGGDGILGEDFERFAPAGGGDNLVAFAFEQHLADPKAGGLVVDAKDEAVHRGVSGCRLVKRGKQSIPF